MTEYNKLVNGEVVPMTEQEIAERQAEEAQARDNALNGYLPQYRFKREVGGVLYLGKTIQTDRETRANWIGILINAQANANYTVAWKTSDGSFAEYDASEAIGAALAVSDHVQKCFDAEAEMAGQTFLSQTDVETAFENYYSGE
jgi:hypothetical protein